MTRRRTLCGMDELPVIEDERGVDISQIRRQLRMSVEDRVVHMVEVANTLMDLRSSVRFIDVPKSART